MTSRNRIRALGRWLVVASSLAIGAGPSALAQEVRATVDASTRPAIEVGLYDVNRSGGDVSAKLRLGVDPGATLEVRWSDAIGALGTVVVEGSAEARLGGAAWGGARHGVPVARASLGARGVIGPVAARIEVKAFGDDAVRFRGPGSRDAAPFDTGAAARVGLEGRASRTWVLGAETSLWRGTPGWAWDVDATARARALLSREVDGRFEVAFRTAPDGSYLGAGAGVVWAPRRAPEIGATLWLDRRIHGATVRLLPGLEVAGGWRSGADRWALRASLRPAGRLANVGSLEASWQRTIDEVTWRVEFGSHLDADDGLAVDLRVTYAVPLSATSAN